MLVTLVGLSRLTSIKKLSTVEKMEIGGLLGVILMTVLGIFGTERGSQFARYLMYAPIFCAPILLRFLSRLGNWSRIVPVFSAAVIFILALPSFLSSTNTIATDAIYPDEIAVGQFLEKHSINQGKDFIFFRTIGNSGAWAQYYVPNASLKRPSTTSHYDENAYWKDINELVSNFQETTHDSDKQKVFLIDQKSFAVLQHLFNIPPDDLEWAKLRERLSTTNMVYNNGNAAMYAQ
jgi:hypothetical protein